MSWGIHIGSVDQVQGGWCRHTTSRWESVGIAGRLAHTDGQEGVLVVEEEVGEEWTGQVVEGIDWGERAKGEWTTKRAAVLRVSWPRSVDRDRVYDKGP